GAGVAHDAAALVEERRHSALHGPDVLADAQRGRSTLQHLDYGVDLALVVDRPGVFDPALRHLVSWLRRGSAGSPRTRSPSTLRMTSEVPPSIVLARARRNRPRG